MRGRGFVCGEGGARSCLVPCVSRRTAGAGSGRSTNELLVGLLEEDGVVGLVRLAFGETIASNTTVVPSRGHSQLTGIFASLLPLALCCVELSWGVQLAVMAQLLSNEVCL